LLKGKEIGSRVLERFGFYKSDKKTSNNYVWIHAASVGESLVAIVLVNGLAKLMSAHHFLITTGTITSAKVVQKMLPERSVHQFVVIDEYFCIKRFLKFWNPEIGIFVESEIWPNLVFASAKLCPVFLVNATMSDKSFACWSKYPFIASNILDNFTKVLCQTKLSTDRYKTFLSDKTKVQYLGNLKFSIPKPNINASDLSILKEQVNSRVVFLCASTHEGDEEIICRIHKKLCNQYQEILTVIVPRHPERSAEVSNIVKLYGLNFAIRSRGDAISNATQVYIADSIGEMGLFFSISNITFIGGSFCNGGHNIIEPAFFDAPIIFGPDMKNFREIANEFLESKAATQINCEDELFQRVISIINETDKSSASKSSAAKSILRSKADILSNYINQLSDYLPDQ
jgi:3-deoxy-D-manno-octulosonic-acid transferase